METKTRKRKGSETEKEEAENKKNGKNQKEEEEEDSDEIEDGDVPQCNHLTGNIKFSANKKKICNNLNWHCNGTICFRFLGLLRVVCGSTEEVWACLSCGFFACGRNQKRHALKHWKETDHKIVLEVNSKLCYW